MASGRAFQRLEVALGALGLTAAALVLIIAIDALRFHVAAVLTCACHLQVADVGAEGWAFIALGVIDLVIIVRAARSLVLQLRAHRAFRLRLPVTGVVDVDGEPVRVIPSRTPHAFCAGLLRPAVYVSHGLLGDCEDRELRAVVAHEAHHRARRDPLRLLLARVVSDAFRPLPPLATLAERHVELADLAADAAAVRRLGDVQPVASALVRFDDMHARSGGGIAPERVDHLARTTPPPSVSAWLLGAVAIGLAGLAALGIPLALGRHPEPALPIALEATAIVVACMPSYLAARRVDACLHPAADYLT